jgi:hypothetical protein
MAFFRILSFILTLSPGVLMAQVEPVVPNISITMGGENTTLPALLKTNKIVGLFLGQDDVKTWKTLSMLDALNSEFQYRGSNLVLLPYIVGKGPKDIDGLSEEHWLNLPLMGDPTGDVARAFNVGTFPQLILVDPFGQVFFKGVAPGEGDLRRIINDRVDKPVVKAFCPVDKMWVVVTDKTPSVVYKRERFYFCTPEDHDGRRMDEEFLQSPDCYAKEAKAMMAGESAKRNPTTKTETAADVATYQCPMKDIPPQRKPGRCTKCGMLLERIEK